MIDHIPAGKSIEIVQLLKLSSHEARMSIGLRLPSVRLGVKDIIKIEERFLSKDEANQVSLFAPEATISIIQDFSVTTKCRVENPGFIVGFSECGNSNCVTRQEHVPSYFLLHQIKNKVQLTCRYCGRELKR